MCPTDAFLNFRRELRAARATVQADSEDYMAVWKVVESLVAYLRANCKDHKKNDLQVICINLFADGDAPRKSQEIVKVSYQRLREARNAYVHEGAVS